MSATLNPARWCSTKARRCAFGNRFRAATRATVFSSGGAADSGGRDAARKRLAVRRLRQPLIACRVATWRTPGSSYDEIFDRRGHALV
jgi:hypothetical protein